jgi:hypothetical protein
MSKCLCTFLLLCNFKVIQAQGKRPRGVIVNVIKQQTVKVETDIPGANRQITFSIENNTDTVIVIPGFRSTAGFFPAGVFVKYDRRRHMWESPFKDNRIPPFAEMSELFPDKYVLSPGAVLTFYDMAQLLDRGLKCRRTIYVFTSSLASEPTMLRSDVFILR